MKTPRTFIDTAYSTIFMQGHTLRIRKAILTKGNRGGGITVPDNLAYYSRTRHHVQFEVFGSVRGGSILEKSESAIHHIKNLKKKKIYIFSMDVHNI